MMSFSWKGHLCMRWIHSEEVFYKPEKVVIVGDQSILVENSKVDIEGGGKFYSPYTGDVDNIKIVVIIEQISGKRTDKLIVEIQDMSALHYLQPQFAIRKEMFAARDFKRNPNGVIYYTPPYMEAKASAGSMRSFLGLFMLAMNIFVLDVYVQAVDVLQQEHHIHRRAISRWGTTQSNKAQTRMMD